MDSPQEAASLAPELGSAAASIELREEEVIADRKMVQLGVARIRRRLVTEVHTFEVTVCHEELEVEHVPYSPENQRGGQQDREEVRILEPGESITLTLVAEELVVHKRPVVSSAVVVGKRTVEEVDSRSVVVRREEAHIINTGELEMEIDEAKTTRSGLKEQ